MSKTPDDATQIMTAERVKARVTAAQVAEYLRRHPDFLLRHPDLLDGQAAPARKKGEGIIDLQQFMVEKLRRDVARLRADQDDILANTRDNLSTQERIHKAVLSLLAAGARRGRAGAGARHGRRDPRRDPPRSLARRHDW
jgi:hypothetical protein